MAAPNPYSKYLKEIKRGGTTYKYYHLPSLSKYYCVLPYSVRILLESAVRNCDGVQICESDVKNLLAWETTHKDSCELTFKPARVLLQDFTGVPAVVDFAAMRDAVNELGGDPLKVNPICPSDLVIDHSVQVDVTRTPDAAQKNQDIEFERNKERFTFLKWGARAFTNMLIVPPGSGICHQVNLEYLARVVFSDGGVLYPDSVVGTDSHTTMINGLGVLGWGVGGIEAEAVMLGQAITMLVPQVVGYKIVGKLDQYATSTDVVLTITKHLRQVGVVGKFVEFFGPGVAELSIADRATVSNMCPEYGATVGFFPIDKAGLDYLRQTNRDEEKVQLVEDYLRAVGLYRDFSNQDQDPVYSEVVTLNLANVQSSVSGPKRPHDRVSVVDMPSDFQQCLTNKVGLLMCRISRERQRTWDRTTHFLCWCRTLCVLNATRVMLRSPLKSRSWVHDKKTASRSTALCSGVIPSWKHRQASHWGRPLGTLSLVSAGAVVLIGLGVCAGWTADGKVVYLRDIWPTRREVQVVEKQYVIPAMFKEVYSRIEEGSTSWRALQAPDSALYPWDPSSTYIKRPPFFEGMTRELPSIKSIENAYVLLNLGDSVTTDHISPAGSIARNSPAARYLAQKGLTPREFNSYGSRRGNDAVMVRGTFANIRLVNKFIGQAGPKTIHVPSGEVLDVYDAAERYAKENAPLIALVGKDYGSGSSRDWAAKGPYLLGIRAVIAESFERIHRSNLVGMGIIPLQYLPGQSAESLGLTGKERYTINIPSDCRPLQEIQVQVDSGMTFPVILRFDTEVDLTYFRHGGILNYMIRSMLG
ncbi:cytoplasmic aconitate hydratase-like [Bacillus rossius redtenbacheri]|uniref:cytoplasmic aconitate hydratase-like n=1 Tax=Bacillus rossius redtenbacheri TaxID=93214 RepID=UPI002FDC929A